MSESKHTPGPWLVQHIGVNIDVSGFIIHAPLPETDRHCKDPDICKVYAIGDDGKLGGTTEANARLIASVPDLLDMLIIALPYVEEATSDPSYKRGAVLKTVNQIRAAIARATGGQNASS